MMAMSASSHNPPPLPSRSIPKRVVPTSPRQPNNVNAPPASNRQVCRASESTRRPLPATPDITTSPCKASTLKHTVTKDDPVMRHGRPQSVRTQPRSTENHIRKSVSATELSPPPVPPRRQSTTATGISIQPAKRVSNYFNVELPQDSSKPPSLEDRFRFHKIDDLPPPEEFTDMKKTYSSQQTSREKRTNVRNLPPL